MTEDNRQSKNEFLAQFNATILEQDPLPDVVTLQNKFGQAKKICFANIPRMTPNNDFWTFDGVMSDRQRNELIKLGELANKRGFKLVSTVYVTSGNPLEFEDKYGTRFYAKPNSIKNGKWPKVNRKKEEVAKIENKLAQYGAKLYDSNEYVNSKSTLTVVNKFGIQKKVIANNMGAWGPEFQFWTFDGKTSDYKLKEWKILNEIVSSHGGKLLSPKYIDSKTLLEVEDLEGNKFFTTSISLKRGKWQPNGKASVRNADKYLKELQEIAVKNGGKLLSDKYVNNQTPLEFQDKYGIVFKKTPSSIKNGYWRENENFLNHKIQRYSRIVELAKEKGGEVLSSEYEGVKIKMKFKDKQGNIFWMTPDSVLNKKSWSPYEKGNCLDPKFHLDKLSEIANEKGGRLISKKFRGSTTPLLFKDQFGNKFWKEPTLIKRGYWSPFLTGSTSEAITKQCFEYLFGQPFIKTRSIIKSKRGTKLELDGFCKELKIAFEYQGQHHYSPKVFVSSKNTEKQQKAFNQIKTLDEDKKIACEQENITLICIPFFVKCVNSFEYISHVLRVIQEHPRYETYLKNKIKNRDMHGFKVDFKSLFRIKKILSVLEDIVAQKGGKLISREYFGNNVPLLVEDIMGDIFKITPTGLKAGNWQILKNFHTKPINDKLSYLSTIAELRGGKLLSKKYLKINSLLDFENEKGEHFRCSPKDIIKGYWKK